MVPNVPVLAENLQISVLAVTMLDHTTGLHNMTSK